MTTVRFETGQILNNRYRLERVLGKGGMGQVFLAEDLSGGGEVALKTVREAVDESDQRRFEREIRTLKTLEHPHIVPFRDLGWVGKTLFYTMAYLPGVTLEEVIAARGAVSTTEELDWHLGVSLQIAETLGYLHERHIVHRDVKPSNILLSATGLGSELPAAADWIEIPEVHVSLSDFGLVKPRDGNGALTRSALGTPQYMSPEQIEASPAVDGRSDLYSLGVILYRVATGRLPFERLSEVLSRRSPRPLREFNEELPELLEDAVERLLDFEPFRRPPHAREVVELLRAVLGRKEQRATGKTVATKMAQPSFTGRALELEHLHTAAARAARGEGRWVAITGERGIGKTWLVTRSDFKSHALVAERLSIYSGTFTRKQPHSGFQQLLQGVLRHVERRHGRQRVIETLGRWGRHLRTFFPLLSGEEWWQGCPPVEEAVGEQILKERVFETVVAVLTAHAEVAPRVLLLEDLHYGDEFDLELLHRLVIQAIQLPILVITTHRPDFERRFRGLERLLHEIRAEERLDELEMKPLDQGEARAMVSSMLAPERPISTAFAEFILQRTDGVPLYLLHLTNSLWNRDLVRLEGEEWRVDREAIGALPIPESTRSHFLLILDEISHQELKILNLAAVIGERFSFDLLLEVLEMDEFELDTVCRDLVHGGIIEEHQDGFRFLHSFEQEIILTRLTRPMFRRLHARVGRILERRHRDDVEAHVGEIAEHMYLGGEQQKGLDYLQRAARKAEESYATRTALDYSTKALALSQDHGVRRELLVGIGELHHRLGEPEEALSHFREAILYFTAVEELLIEEGRSLAEEEEEELKAYAQLLLKFGEVYARVGDYTAALENFDKSERISRRIGDRAGIAISLGRQGAAHAYREDLASSERAYAAAVEYYQEVPPSAGLVIALVGLSYVERMRGNLEKALLHSTQALSISEESGDLQQTAQILTGYGNLCRALGRLRDAARAFERSMEISEQLGNRRGLAVSLMSLGRTYSFLGDFRRGLEALNRSRELFEATGDKQGSILTLGNLGTLHFYLGDFAAARSFLERYLEEARRQGTLRAVADALHCRGVVELEMNETAAAEALFEESLESFEKAGDREGVLRNRVQLARVWGRQGLIDEALALSREARDQAQAMDAREPRAEALRIEAEALRTRGEAEAAVEPGSEALRAFEDQSLPYHLGVCARTLGKIYRDLGYLWADQAGKNFERALRTFEMLGARHALAQTQLEYGSFLILVDEVNGARELFLEALRTFEELGVDHELERVRRELEEIS